MDDGGQPAGGVALTVHSLARSMNTVCVPPPSGTVSVVVNGGDWPGGACCASTPSVGAGAIPSLPSLSVGTQSTTTANVGSGAGDGAGVPGTTFVTSSCARLVTLPFLPRAALAPSPPPP